MRKGQSKEDLMLYGGVAAVLIVALIVSGVIPNPFTGSNGSVIPAPSGSCSVENAQSLYTCASGTQIVAFVCKSGSWLRTTADCGVVYASPTPAPTSYPTATPTVCVGCGSILGQSCTTVLGNAGRYVAEGCNGCGCVAWGITNPSTTPTLTPTPCVGCGWMNGFPCITVLGNAGSYRPEGACGCGCVAWGITNPSTMPPSCNTGASCTIGGQAGAYGLKDGQCVCVPWNQNVCCQTQGNPCSVLTGKTTEGCPCCGSLSCQWAGDVFDPLRGACK